MPIGKLSRCISQKTAQCIVEGVRQLHANENGMEN